MSMPTAARTYNQNHIARKYTSGKRRMSIYWTRIPARSIGTFTDKLRWRFRHPGCKRHL